MHVATVWPLPWCGLPDYTWVMWVRLTAVGSRAEAEVLRGLLESHDISCAVQGESTNTTMGTEAGYAEIVLKVESEDVERALGILQARIEAEEAEYPVSAVAPTGALCPVHQRAASGVCTRCGSFVCERCDAGEPALCEQCSDRSGDGALRRARKARRLKLVTLVLLAIFFGLPPMFALFFSRVLRELFGS